MIPHPYVDAPSDAGRRADDAELVWQLLMRSSRIGDLRMHGMSELRCPRIWRGATAH